MKITRSDLARALRLLFVVLSVASILAMPYVIKQGFYTATDSIATWHAHEFSDPFLTK